MSVNRVFQLIEETRDAANWKAAFGEPQQVEGKTVIPVAQVAYGFGLGFGQGAGKRHLDDVDPAAQDEGGGGGGGATSRPLGVLVVAGSEVSFEPIQDEGKVALAAIAVGALFVWELGSTLRALFGRR